VEIHRAEESKSPLKASDSQNLQNSSLPTQGMSLPTNPQNSSFPTQGMPLPANPPNPPKNTSDSMEQGVSPSPTNRTEQKIQASEGVQFQTGNYFTPGADQTQTKEVEQPNQTSQKPKSVQFHLAEKSLTQPGKEIQSTNQKNTNSADVDGEKRGMKPPKITATQENEFLPRRERDYRNYDPETLDLDDDTIIDFTKLTNLELQQFSDKWENQNQMKSPEPLVETNKGLGKMIAINRTKKANVGRVQFNQREPNLSEKLVHQIFRGQSQRSNRQPDSNHTGTDRKFQPITAHMDLKAKFCTPSMPEGWNVSLVGASPKAERSLSDKISTNSTTSHRITNWDFTEGKCQVLDNPSKRQ
jgi:hypothetical protein